MDLDRFYSSKKYKEMLIADRYYEYDHDILYRVKQTIDSDGNLVDIKNVPNHKLVDNRFRNLLDQKANYVLSKPLTLDGENQEYIKELHKIMDSKFLKTLYLLCKNCYKYGIGWLCIYINKNGELCFKNINSKEVIPIWADKEHTELEKVIRAFNYYDEQNNLIQYQEEYTVDGITVSINDKVTEFKPYLQKGIDNGKWGIIPMIPFKCNDDELGLLSRVKTLQDALNENLSDYKNDMEQNWRNTIFIVKGYNPEGEKFRYNLTQYGCVGIDENTDIDTITVDVNASNYESMANILTKSILENGRGFDSKNEMLGHDPNEMNIQSMYSTIDLDANELELEFQSSLMDVITIINKYLLITTGVDYSEDEVKFIFNRDIMVNESQAIQDCLASSSLVSTETMLSKHPFVSNVKTELDRLKKEQLDYEREDIYKEVSEDEVETSSTDSIDNRAKQKQGAKDRQ